MRLLILDNEEEVCEFAAKLVKARIKRFRPSETRPFVLGLPTGSTPTNMYRKLVEFHRSGELSFKNVITFNMDEYVGLPIDHPQSYHSYMWQNLFKHIDIKPQNVHILDGNASDLTEECEAFEAKMKECGGVNLFIGGVGPDGHIAFNEPGSSLTSRTRVKTLNQDTIRANARFFNNDITKVPKQALTVGVQTVMNAQEVMILVCGAHKALVLHSAIEGGINHMCTFSAFQMHPNVIVVCDEESTLELRVKTVKYFKNLTRIHTEMIE